MGRKAISKKLRFEVFKRDSFTCQYCGKESPNVVLNVDHIDPVKNGGDNNITNLITSCFGCNSGKGARLLSDGHVVKKQKKILDELQERRNQIEMISKWREDLLDNDNYEIDKICEYIYKVWNTDVFDLHENIHFTRNKLKKLVKDFSSKLVYDAIDRASDVYIDKYEPFYAFDKLGGICYNIKNDINNEFNEIYNKAYKLFKSWNDLEEDYEFGFDYKWQKKVTFKILKDLNKKYTIEEMYTMLQNPNVLEKSCIVFDTSWANSWEDWRKEIESIIESDEKIDYRKEWKENHCASKEYNENFEKCVKQLIKHTRRTDVASK
tara:strand:+ start:187 stop:1152 length:966 start_codon:yes stop_codon:yes gene_type:complete